MSEVLERLLGNEGASEAKSYLIGLERGRIWAEDYADYFELREWAELSEDGEPILPSDEDLHLRLLMRESALSIDAYVSGWLAGVREVRGSYQSL
ncbi:MAG: hypothetical protein AB1295_03840 [Candidatus Micrarchaeota archaeon]